MTSPDWPCHILYVLSDYSSQLNEVIEKMKSKSTLIITDKAGFTSKGAGINFVVQENKQKIELNKANIKRYKIKSCLQLSGIGNSGKINAINRKMNIYE